MKIIRTLTLLCVIFGTLSCNKSFEYPMDTTAQIANTYKVSMNNVMDYVNMREKTHITKSDINRSIIPVLSTGDTVMYIVNYDNGWELLSADTRMPKVLAMCDSGNLSSIESLHTNPAQKNYWENISNKIMSLSNIDQNIAIADDNWTVITPLTESPDTWTNWYLTGVELYRTDTTHEQDHLMRTKWNQGNPWNAKAPYINSNKTIHCNTGCTVVAACQVLYYLRDYFNISIPIYGDCTCEAFIPEGKKYVILNDSNVTFDGNTLSDSYWNLMPLAFSSSCGHEYTATLMTYMGYLLRAEYLVNATGAATYNIYNAYRNVFGIDCVKTTFSNINIEYLIEQIVENKLPCIFEIWKSDDSGHVVVLDGLRQIRRTYIHHYQKHNNLAQRQYKDVSVAEYSNFVAINWGWGGSKDADSNGTIWYNLGSSWYDYNDFKNVVCGFSLLNN